MKVSASINLGSVDDAIERLKKRVEMDGRQRRAEVISRLAELVNRLSPFATGFYLSRWYLDTIIREPKEKEVGHGPGVTPSEVHAKALLAPLDTPLIFGNDAEYAGVIEYGSSDQPPRLVLNSALLAAALGF